MRNTITKQVKQNLKINHKKCKKKQIVKLFMSDESDFLYIFLALGNNSIHKLL